eukprot:EG_transcript_17678
MGQLVQRQDWAGKLPGSPLPCSSFDFLWGQQLWHSLWLASGRATGEPPLTLYSQQGRLNGFSQGAGIIVACTVEVGKAQTGKTGERVDTSPKRRNTVALGNISHNFAENAEVTFRGGEARKMREGERRGRKEFFDAIACRIAVR